MSDNETGTHIQGLVFPFKCISCEKKKKVDDRRWRKKAFGTTHYLVFIDGCVYKVKDVCGQPMDG